MSPTHQDLSNDTTFSQIKSRVPVPLNILRDFVGHPTFGGFRAEFGPGAATLTLLLLLVHNILGPKTTKCFFILDFLKKRILPTKIFILPHTVVMTSFRSISLLTGLIMRVADLMAYLVNISSLLMVMTSFRSISL